MTYSLFLVAMFPLPIRSGDVRSDISDLRGWEVVVSVVIVVEGGGEGDYKGALRTEYMNT